jgi:membrane protein implicated in regulation of membrane protease activity
MKLFRYEEQFLLGAGTGAGIVTLVMLLVGAWPIPGAVFLVFSGLCFMISGVSMIKREPPQDSSNMPTPKEEQ